MISIVLEFALGVAIGSISGLMLLKRSERGRRTKKHSTRRSRRASGVGRQQRSSELLAIKRAITANPRPRVEAAPTVIVAEVQHTTSAPRATLSSCPACGLTAPEKLMAEHLLGSPLHRKQPLAAPLATAHRSTRPRVDASLQEDSRESMRNLLQMLVPPRAFGRRNMQRTVNPLSQLVQTRE